MTDVRTVDVPTAAQARARAVAPLAITAAGVISPAGLGLARLAGAAVADAGAQSLAEITDEVLPDRASRVVTDLPVADYIGRKGVRHLDRTTKLALIACGLALEGFETGSSGPVGVVFGTTSGSIRSSSEYSLATLTTERPYLVNPSLFPNTVMNCAAGQIAIRHGLNGVNATLAGGHLAGIQAVHYARNALRQRHAERILVGGAEEFSAQSAWGWHRSAALADAAPVGEGAAALMVEAEVTAQAGGRTVLGWVLAAETGLAPSRSNGHGAADALADVITAALERSGVGADEITTVSLGSTGHRVLDRFEEEAVVRALGRMPGHVLRVKEEVGECLSAGGPLQIAATLAAWQQADLPASRTAIVTALGHDGGVGCLVLRAADH
jgi:3-oxoacyl-[acyl-carrier-protein] synthase II